eukprot:UN14752
MASPVQEHLRHIVKRMVLIDSPAIGCFLPQGLRAVHFGGAFIDADMFVSLFRVRACECNIYPEEIPEESTIVF